MKAVQKATKKVGVMVARKAVMKDVKSVLKMVVTKGGQLAAMKVVV